MQMYRTLQAQGRKSPPFVHFAQVIERLGEILGGNGSPVPASFQCPDHFATAYLAYNLVRKASKLYGSVEDKDARRRATLDGFLARERVNSKINNTRTWGYDPATGVHKSDLLGDQLLLRARDIIHEIVGKPNLDAICNKAGFGNGASATLKRTESQGPKKFLDGRSVTRGLRSLSEHLIRTSPSWSALSSSDPAIYVDHLSRPSLPPGRLVTVAGAVLDFVPKDLTVDRIILKEPELNGFIQRGIGKELRMLLKRPLSNTDGVDLNRSGQVNSDLAQYGSQTGRLATIDGERASDSLTLALYEFLFPEEWYQLFCMARSPYCLVDGHLMSLGMMSGMGNGFTFEAESIIFYAIGLACAERSSLPFAERAVSIHGDDLIVPSDVYYDVYVAYVAAGIVVNDSKSFSSGPFRESCGGHFFDGFEVKPFYVKTQDGRSRGDWFWLYNSLLLWLNARGSDFIESSKGEQLIEVLLYLGWYASSGKPLQWRVPVDFSRRSGLYSDPPKLVGGSWKTRMVVPRQKTETLPEDGRYLEWLCHPKVTTVYDLLFSKRETEGLYDTPVEVFEVDRYRRLIAWNGFSEMGITTPLWLWSRLVR